MEKNVSDKSAGKLMENNPIHAEVFGRGTALAFMMSVM